MPLIPIIGSGMEEGKKESPEILFQEILFFSILLDPKSKQWEKAKDCGESFWQANRNDIREKLGENLLQLSFYALGLHRKPFDKSFDQLDITPLSPDAHGWRWRNASPLDFSESNERKTAIAASDAEHSRACELDDWLTMLNCLRFDAAWNYLIFNNFSNFWAPVKFLRTNVKKCTKDVLFWCFVVIT